MAAGCLVALAAWMVFRPYEGIVGDAILYVGHGLAQAAPDSVGRDLMFVKDGQFGFSLFNPLLSWLVRRLGPGPSSLVVVVVGQAVWLAATAGLVWVLTNGRARLFVPALVCVAVLPSFYGPFQRLHFAEPIAVPRPYAEAFVIFAMTAALRGRDGLAGLLLVVAAGLHPIMALAGLGTMAVVKSLEDSRWALVLGGLAVVAIAAGLTGLPVASRLFVAMDPSWRGITAARNPMLFLSRWLPSDYGALALQAATLAVAAIAAKGRCRRILGAALATAVLGLGCAYVLGDALSSLLVIQAQLWRMVWLVAVLAGVTLAPTVLELWREDRHGRVTALLLLAGWSFQDQPIVAVVCALSALAMSLVARARRLHIEDRAVWLIAVALCALVAVQVCVGIVEIGVAASAAPDHQALRLLLKLHVLSVPVAVAAISCALLRPRRPASWAPAAALGALVLCIAAAWLWDMRPPIERMMENPSGDIGLVARVAESPGPVIWLDGIEETTLWMRRASWYSTLQGSSIVFSRPLALEWARRRGEAARFGLVPPGDADLPTDVATRPLPILTGDQLAGACADLKGLAWIVLPVLPGVPDPSGVAAIDWTPPAPVVRMSVREQVEWTRIDHYALVNCRSVGTR